MRMYKHKLTKLANERLVNKKTHSYFLSNHTEKNSINFNYSFEKCQLSNYQVLSLKMYN